MLEREFNISNRHIYIVAGILIFVYLSNYLIQFVKVSPESYSAVIRNVMYIVSIAGIVLTFANYHLSLIIFIFVAPLAVYNIPNLPFFFTYGDAYLLILVFVWITRIGLGHEKRPLKTFLDRLIFLFVLLSILSAINSRYADAATREIVQTLEYFVFCYYLFSVTIIRRNILDGIVQGIVVCGGLIALYGIMQYFRLGAGESRITGTFGHFNAMGTFMAMMVTFVFNLAIAEKDRKAKYFFYAVLAVDTLALLMTFSRGAWIGTVTGIIVSAQIRGMVQFIRIFALVMVVFFLMAVIAPPQYIGRMASVPRVEDTSSKNRLRQWQIAYETISSYPLLGVGLENNTDHVIEKYNEPTNGEIHNLFLHVGSERGLPAMLVLIGIFGLFFVRIIKRLNQTEDDYFRALYTALFSAVLAFGIVNIFAYQLIRGIALFFTMFLALFNAGMYVEENEPVESKWAEMLSTLESKRPLAKMGL